MKEKIKVFKFGGASLKNADAMRNVAAILMRYKDDKLVVVGSATAGTTNALEEVVRAHQSGKRDEALAQLDAIRQAHNTLAAALVGEGHPFSTS
ncbi:MAG: hypothetical protein R2795_00845 [Saprospiraceae bacterium]